MDCKKANKRMMQYMDGNIKPVHAAALARHLLKCGNCREHFLAFDEAVCAIEHISQKSFKDFDYRQPSPHAKSESLSAYWNNEMGVFHSHHCGLDPQSPQIGAVMGSSRQTRDDMSNCFETRHELNENLDLLNAPADGPSNDLSSDELTKNLNFLKIKKVLII